MLVLWFLRDGIRVLFKNNFPAYNLHVKMLDFAPFTIRTWKNLNCLRYLFAQTIFTNNLLFEHLKSNYTAFNRDFKQQLPRRLVRWPKVFLPPRVNALNSRYDNLNETTVTVKNFAFNKNSIHILSFFRAIFFISRSFCQM